ncbi:alkaline phosphatase family protein [Neobacillus massiliamazoniensis]|uniref:Type I phosphodiesterase/nucleotide pyrophosphatase n=1 Tax=Neobacillus massiliamazoniensis TaxID=1499688 RepID=A0A0U1NY43_9BACI|nr:alkaline phosphatase family protein [Neobacillus massiliamazoniensis]CRK82927.1 type I phosphodiesterase/nucleotide pyrophosphatase [Neobacillus massiliamazoniensis]
MTSDQIQKKKVILLMIDTLMDSSLQEAIKSEKAPALQFFIENGKYFSNLVSPFPTMSVNVDSTLLTGVYSDKHKVPGLVWYNKNEERIVNYGGHVFELIKLGLKKSMEDIFYNLNHEHLSKKHPTIHEILHERGIQSASINTLLYRGDIQTKLKIPFLLSVFTGLNREMMSFSPNLFTYGAMHKINPLKKNSYFWQKYGFNDKFSANELKYLINRNNLPPFTIVYFPDLDHSTHVNGRNDIKGIAKVDQQLQEILNQFPSWEEALSNIIWIILGDNGQAWIDQNRNHALIDLRKSLGSYRIVKLRKGVSVEDEIVLGVNERMSFIYTLDSQKIPLEEIAKILQKDDRIDVVALKKGNTVTVTSGIHSGNLQFHPEGEFFDEYNQSWSIKGNNEILNLTITENSIEYGEYPDALARLYSSFYSHEGEYIIVSAKPGYEFKGEGSPTHVGGASHGGLHKQDSLASMIICGTDTTPKHMRILDLKDWLLTLIS